MMALVNQGEAEQGMNFSGRLAIPNLARKDSLSVESIKYNASKVAHYL